MPKIVRRGEFYWADWAPGRGSEQTGVRPVLVVQNDTGNRYGNTTIVAACTTVPTKPYPFVLLVTEKESGLPKGSSINLSAILTIDKSRLGDKCGELTPPKMAEVDIALMRSLGLNRFIP
ncbi:MAG: type II toxin-antitoxin system PemK/MazF family toxin [Chloroflexi bacterium]|nr:type II toxin-antitoxin system PemK/MazF family toxin [Chloroflexota bacterium]